MTIHEKIQTARTKKGLSHAEMAVRTGTITGTPVSTHLVQLWEKDVVPSAKNIKAIAEVLNVTSDHLLGVGGK